MRTPSKRIHILAIGLVVLATVAGTYYLFGIPYSSVSPIAGDGPSPTVTAVLDPYADPLFTAQEAISRSLALLPVTATINSVYARLISTSTLATHWFEEDDTSWLPDTPIWLVAVAADGLAMADAIQIASGVSIVNDPSEVGGAFFAWDANLGQVVASGALNPYMAYQDPSTGYPVHPDQLGGYDFRIDKLDLMTDEPLPIEVATAVPTPLPE